MREGPCILSLFLIQTVYHFKNPLLERGSTFLLPLLYPAQENPLKSEMGWTGEHWLKTNLLNLQNLENSIFLAKENKKILKKWSNVRLKFFCCWCTSDLLGFIPYFLKIVIENVCFAIKSGYTVKYSLSPQQILQASSSGFPSGSGYISLYIPPLVNIQIQYLE